MVDLDRFRFSILSVEFANIKEDLDANDTAPFKNQDTARQFCAALRLQV